MTKIEDLIENKNWKKLSEIFEKHKKDIIKYSHNGFNVLHLSIVDGSLDLYNILNKNDILFDTDSEGNNILHLAALYGRNDIVKKIVSDYPELARYHNKKGNTPIFFTIENNSLFKFIVDNADIDPCALNGKNENIFTKNIKRNKKKGDIYYQNIETLLNNQKYKDCIINGNHNSNIPIIICIENNNIDILNLLIENGADLNIHTSSHISPTLAAVSEDRPEIVKILIDAGANIQYCGPEGDENPLIGSIVNHNFPMCKLLIDNGFDVTIKNRFLQTPLIYAIFSKKCPLDILITLVYKTDLNEQCVSGGTPLHFLTEHSMWKNVSEALKHKKLDIFIKDNRNKSPLGYVKPQDLPMFMDIVYASYLNKANAVDPKDPLVGNCHTLNRNCKTDIIKRIIESKRSFPLSTDLMYMSSLNLVKENRAMLGSFNSDALHNIMYTIDILKRYSNLGVPFKYYHDDKFKTEKINMLNNFYGSIHGDIIYDLIAGYVDFLYELSPYIVVWRDEDNYYIDKNLKLYTHKLLNSRKIRYIYVKLTLVASSSGTHANMFFIDKETGTVERFDPYGQIPYLDAEKMDDLFEKEFKNILGEYFNKHQIEYQYLRPKDFMGPISFQIISQDGEYHIRKLGDPSGYCLAWTYWYMEMRMQNPDVHPKDLVDRSIKDIINQNKTIDGSDGVHYDYLFITFIRYYASSLDRKKNNRLISYGINESYVYNLVQQPDDERTISTKSVREFSEIMASKL